MSTTHLRGNNPFSYDFSRLQDQRATNAEVQHISFQYEQLISRGKTLLDSVHGQRKWTEIELVHPDHHNASNRKLKAELVSGDIIQCIGLPSSRLLPVIATYYDYMPQVYAERKHYCILFLFLVGSD